MDAVAAAGRKVADKPALVAGVELLDFPKSLDRPGAVVLAVVRLRDSLEQRRVVRDDGVADDAVPPGHRYTYTWSVPPRAGPGPRGRSRKRSGADGSSSARWRRSCTAADGS